MIGKTLAHYKIIEMIGEGGMGEVWRALDTKLNREVALKILPEEVAGDPERLARLRREAQMLATVSHPHIAVIHSIGQADSEDRNEIHFLEMELVEGTTLEERLRTGPMAVEAAIAVCLQVAEALEAAHEKGVIHRDLKPANVMVAGEDNRVKVLDFGLAKTFVGDETSGDTIARTQLADVTTPGTVVGTAPYMSPEQVRAREVDRRTDIWAFGCLLYEVLTGTRAFDRETAADTVAAILEQEPDWTRLPDATPPAVRRLLQRCLRKTARDRLHAIGDARLDLEDALGEGPDGTGPSVARGPALMNRRRAAIVIGGLVAAVAIAAAVWQLRPENRLVYLIDTTSPLGVYDPETRRHGGTNADDLTSALGSLPVTLVKETSSPLWQREHQVLAQRPALIVIHVSAFAHPAALTDFQELDQALAEVEKLGLESPKELGNVKLIGLLGYIALGSPRTRFVVYSRGAFAEEAKRAQWIRDVETRFPQLEGKITPYHVPGGVENASFRDPVTAGEIRDLVGGILGVG